MTTVKGALVRTGAIAVIAAALFGVSTMGGVAIARGGHGGDHGGGHAAGGGHGHLGGLGFVTTHGHHSHDSHRIARGFRGYGGLYGFAGGNSNCNPYVYPYNCY
jgi:hypothetical protein